MKKIAENIFMLFGNGFNCNSYLLASPEEDYLLIDTGLGRFNQVWNSEETNTIQELNNLFDLNITKVVLTHAHLDHIGGLISLESRKKMNKAIYCHKIEKKFIEKPDTRYIDPLLNTQVQPLKIDKTLNHGDKLEFGDFSFEIIHTPGHTIGSICLFEETKKILYSGDCVFPEGSFGRIDFPGSNPDQMLDSIEILSSLDINSLFAGHMDPLITNARNSIHQSYKNAKSFITVA